MKESDKVIRWIKDYFEVVVGSELDGTRSDKAEVNHLPVSSVIRTTSVKVIREFYRYI